MYRQSVEATTRHRLAAVEATDDLEEIERVVGCGQIEELIEQANTEFGLVQRMKVWKAWEPLEVSEPEKQWNYTYKTG